MKVCTIFLLTCMFDPFTYLLKQFSHCFRRSKHVTEKARTSLSVTKREYTIQYVYKREGGVYLVYIFSAIHASMNNNPTFLFSYYLFFRRNITAF